MALLLPCMSVARSLAARQKFRTTQGEEDADSEPPYSGAVSGLLVCLLATASLVSSAAERILGSRRAGDLQKAIDSAKPGDVITLAPGAVYIGNFVLPVRRRGDRLHHPPVRQPPTPCCRPGHADARRRYAALLADDPLAERHVGPAHRPPPPTTGSCASSSSGEPRGLRRHHQLGDGSTRRRWRRRCRMTLDHRSRLRPWRSACWGRSAAWR